MAMGADPISDGPMDKKPRKSTDHVINAAMCMDIVFVGLIMAVVTLAAMDMRLSGGLFTDRSVDVMLECHLELTSTAQYRRYRRL